MALMPVARRTSAGNNFRACAPALMARNASVGEKMPGYDRRPHPSVRAMTASLQSGETTNVPPAAAIASTSSAPRTVPAPTDALPCSALAAARIEFDRPRRVAAAPRSS